MPRTEVSWTRESEDGESVQAFAHRVGERWIFFSRRKRFEEWEENPSPPLEDWLALLDGVRRRIARRLARPDDEALVLKCLRTRFPDAGVPPR